MINFHSFYARGRLDVCLKNVKEIQAIVICFNYIIRIPAPLVIQKEITTPTALLPGTFPFSLELNLPFNSLLSSTSYNGQRIFLCNFIASPRSPGFRLALRNIRSVFVCCSLVAFGSVDKMLEMLAIISSISLPGHSCLLHSLVVLSGPNPLQSFPPFAGGGLVHVRILVFTPLPQVFEHTLYFCQSEYPPCTTREKRIKIR